jgi:RNA polymerase sigma factor (sigma-70 family)
MASARFTHRRSKSLRVEKCTVVDTHLRQEDNEVDLRLAARVREGDEVAFVALLRRHEIWFIRSARGMGCDFDTAQELLNDVFCDIWRRGKKWNLQKTMRGYLLATLLRAVWNLRRRRCFRETAFARAVSLGDDSLLTMLRESCSQTDSIGNDWSPDTGAALATVTPADYRLIQLVYTEGYNEREAGAILGISHAAARQRHRRALQRLRLAFKVIRNCAVRTVE